MSDPRDDMWAVKTGAATLAVCLVRTLQKADPEFEYNFLQQLEKAYYHYRDNCGATRADGSLRDVQGVLETLSWTRELLTGWSNITGQGEPLIKS